MTYQRRRVSQASPTRQPLLAQSTPAHSATSLNVPNSSGTVPVMCVPIFSVANDMTPPVVNGAGSHQLPTVVVADERGIRQPHVEVLLESPPPEVALMLDPDQTVPSNWTADRWIKIQRLIRLRRIQLATRLNEDGAGGVYDGQWKGDPVIQVCSRRGSDVQLLLNVIPTWCNEM